MEIKKLTFLLSLTFLFLFSGSSVVFSDDLQDGLDAAARGDYKTAYKLWLPLVEQGLAEAQHNLGVMYQNGLGVPQDYKEAVRLYRLSAEQGNGGAQSNLGVRYRNGQGVPQDYKEAVKWFRLAAEQGFTNAQSNLGVMYELGQGVPQDYKEAEKWYRLSAEQGHAQAQYNLGWMYYDGQGVPQDYKEAVKWFRLTAEQGDTEAQYNLGQMYRQGKGVLQDYKEAVKWYRLAAEQGDSEAQFNLAKMYFKAQVPLNYKEAAKWYRLAADQGHGSAQNNLGWMYQVGEGVPQDYVLAHMWFNLAASNSASNPLEGLTEKLNRNTVEKKMTPSQIEKAKEMARNWKPKTQKVRVRPLEELDSELEPAVVTDEELVEKIIIIMGCHLCHKIPGIDFALGELGPALSLKQMKSSFKNPNYKGKAKDLREYIVESILNPSAYVVFNDLEGETYPNIHPSNHFGQMLSDKALNKIVDFLMK